MASERDISSLWLLAEAHNKALSLNQDTLTKVLRLYEDLELRVKALEGEKNA